MINFNRVVVARQIGYVVAEGSALLARNGETNMGGWNELDTTTWGVITAEVRGKRPKEWVREPGGALWLRKQPRIRSGQVFPYEPAIEG